jgi:hypothetical protein
MMTRFLLLGFIFFSLVSCGVQNISTAMKTELPSVEMRLNFDKNLYIKLIEISLERKDKKHTQKVIGDQSIYIFNDLKPGKYVILLTFSKNGNPLTYGYEYCLLHGEKMDSKGRISPVTEVIRDSEIRVRRSRLTIVELSIRYEKREISPQGKGLEILSGDFGKLDFYYMKEDKTYYYNIIFTLTDIKISKQKKQKKQ